MNATENNGRVTTPASAPTGFKLKPAARRQYLLQMIRERVPRDPAPPKNP